jgi:Gpi18-like mannosyltransferase
MARRTSLAVLLLCLVLAAFGLAYQTQPLISVDLGAGAEKFLDNFHAAERGYRWSQDRSAVWLSGLGGGNLPWTVSVRLSGSRPAGGSAPHVRLSANGQLLGEFNAQNEERDYEFVLPAGRLGLNGDLLLQIESDTFTSRADPRALGVRVLRVQATQGAGIALPSAKTFGFMLGIVAAGLIAAWAIGKSDSGRGAIDQRQAEGPRPSAPARARLCPVRRGIRPAPREKRGHRMQAAYRREQSDAGRWAEREAPGAPFVAVAWSCVVLLLGTLVVAINRAEGAWWVEVAGLGAMGAAALLAVVCQLLPRAALNKRQWRTCLLMFGLAALIRLVIDTGRGYEGDVALYMALAWKAVTYGVQTTFLTINDVLPANTPPVLAYPLWAMGWLYHQVFSPLFPPPWLNDPSILRYMLRLPALAADLAAAAIIARVTAVRGARVALIAGAAYLFNPALIFDGAYWGQTAALHSIGMLVAAVAAMQPAFGLAGAAIALAVLTKPQALATAPLVMFAAWRGRALQHFIPAGVITAIVALLPFLLSGNMQSVLQQYAQTAQYHPFVSVNAHNLWWFATGGQGWQADSNLILGLLSFRAAGIILFGLASLLSLLVVWKDRNALYAAAAFQSFAFFMLFTQIHENHLLPMFAPLLIACALERKGWWLFGALTLTALVNMALHDPNLVMALGYAAEEIYGGPGLAWPRWLNAAAQTGLFTIFTAQMVRRLRRSL